MLKETTKENFEKLSTHKKIHSLIMVRLKTLGKHHRVTREMICSELEPGKIRAQICALLRIKQSVQWMRESALRKANYLERAIEESALTLIYMTTVCYWLKDHSKDFQKTSELLDKLLNNAEFASHALDHWVYQPCRAFIKKCPLC